MTIKDFIEKKIAVAFKTPEQAKEFAEMIKSHDLRMCGHEREKAHEWIIGNVNKLFKVAKLIEEPEVTFSYGFVERNSPGFAWCTIENHDDPHYTEVGWKIVPFEEFKQEEKKKRYFSMEQWKKDNEFMKKTAPLLFDLCVETWVQDCDGVEIREDGTMVGKSGAVYNKLCEEGVVKDEPPKPLPREVVIRCDDETVTTAELIVNGKTVKTATAKRNPEDEFNFWIGAKLALNRLSGKEEKREFVVGDKVVFHDLKRDVEKNGKRGRIIKTGLYMASCVDGEKVFIHEDNLKHE